MSRYLLQIWANICYYISRSFNKSFFNKKRQLWVTGAVVAHRTLNPLVLGSNTRSPISRFCSEYTAYYALYYGHHTLVTINKLQSSHVAAHSVLTQYGCLYQFCQITDSHISRHCGLLYRGVWRFLCSLSLQPQVLKRFVHAV